MIAAAWVVAVAWLAAALVLAPRRSRLAVMVAVPGLLAAGIAAGLASDHPALVDLSASLCPAAATLLVLGLPDGRLASGVRRWAVAVVAGGGLLAGVVVVMAGHGLHPLAVAGAVVAATAASLPAAHQRYRASRGATRERLQLVGAGAVLAASTALGAWAAGLVTGSGRTSAIAVTGVVFLAAALAAGQSARARSRSATAMAGAIGVGALVGAVATGVAVAVLVLGRLPGVGEQDVAAVMLLGAAVAGVTAAPLRRLLRESAEHLASGDRQPPEDVVRTFVERASRGVPDDELLLQLVESLRRTMGARAAEVWTGTGGVLDRAVSLPTLPSQQLTVHGAALPMLVQSGVVGPAWLGLWVPELLQDRSAGQLRVAPACHSGALLGLVVVERAADDDAFTEDDDRALGELGRRLGVVLDNLQLNSALRATLADLQHSNEELRASRSRLVAAADDERRRIERNLHDGAQQYLVALAVNMRLARDLLSDDPDAAGEILEQLDGDIRETITQVRELAHGIYPPLLMQAGLGEALRAAATRSPLPVKVDVDGVGRQPTAVEAAVYFCCLEALQNASKHAPDSSVSIRIWHDESNLRFEVTDDGPGFDPARTGSGQGFQNMSDRVGAIGGTVRWESAPGGGTTVAGSIPVGSIAMASIHGEQP